MKKTFLLAVLLLLIHWLNGQDSLVIKKAKRYKASITMPGGTTATGYLASMSDSTISISEKPLLVKAGAADDPDLRTFDYNTITKVKLKRKGAVGRGILYGALIGLTAGVISGYAQGDDPPCAPFQPDPNDFYGIGNFFGQLGEGLCNLSRTTASEKAVVYGILEGAGGAMVGALVGAIVHKTFIIKGNRDKLKSMKKTLLP